MTLNGADRQTVLRGLDEPRSIVVDSAAGKLYWMQRDDLVLKRCNLDGSNQQLRLTATSPIGAVALDVAATG